MINCCDKSAPPWPSTSGPCLPSACDEDAKPNCAVVSFSLGLERLMALCSIPTALAMPAACGLPLCKRPWWSTWLPGIPTPARPQACIRWRSASARPTCPRPGVESAGMSLRYGAFCARRPPRALPRVAGLAPRRHAGAHPLCRPWGLARVSSPLQRRCGLPCRCRPLSVRRPLKPPSTA